MKQRLLIWFRRFRPKYGEKFRFHAALSEACSGLAYPVTIQDSSYSSSFLGSFFGKGWIVLPAGVIAFVIGLIFLPLGLSLLGVAISEKFFLIVSVFLAIGIVFLAIRVYRRLGYRPYTGEGAARQLKSDLGSIKSGRRGSVTGVDVIQCDDDVWRDVVAAALTEADIAIIDISELTESLAWEISQAFRSLPRDRILFVCEERGDNAPSRLTELNGVLLGIQPDLDIDKLNDEIVAFPSKMAGVGPRRRRQVVEFGKRLRLTIADRLL